MIDIRDVKSGVFSHPEIDQQNPDNIRTSVLFCNLEVNVSE